MLRYRTYRNTDSPALAAIWRSRAGHPGLAQPVSVDLFDQLVLGKVYFDSKGLILAFDEDRPVGFAHAAFGPSEQRDRISTEKGVTCVIVVRPDSPEAEVAAGLLERCEAYLRGQGARLLYGGAAPPMDPFYLGLYGGSQLPGVLDSDTVPRDLYRSRSYREIDHTLILRRPPSPVRPPIDRRQMQVRRRMMVEAKVDPPTRTWWEACTVGDFDLTRFELVSRGGGSAVATAIFRSMDPLSGVSPGRGAGLLDLSVAPANRRQGLATFLLTEAFRQLASQGVTSIEAQTSDLNSAYLGLLRKLSFEEQARGIVFLKEVRD